MIEYAKLGAAVMVARLSVRICIHLSGDTTNSVGVM